MISDLDEVLRQLLIEELPIKNGEVHIEFHQPTREWSGRLSRPTLDLFLYDLRENSTLRQVDWEIERRNGTFTRQRVAARVDLHYMITAWATEPEDEHRLLTRTLLALFRHPTLPARLLPESLQGQPAPIPIRVAQFDEFRSPADVWSALDNELRPSIILTLTLALDPYSKVTGPLVRSRDIRFGQAAGLPAERQLQPDADQDRFWMVGGQVRGDGAPAGVQVRLVERGADVRLDAEGRFVIGNLEAGEYTLEVVREGKKPAQHRITVPAESYDIEL